MKPDLLLRATRKNITEREHYGYIMVVDKNGNILSQIGDSQEEHFFLRSCAKPFQALPIVTSNSFNNFNFSIKELAVCCSSHSGSKDHINTIKGILRKIDVKEDKLKCYGHEPSDKESKTEIIKNNLTISSIYNNCSGKHSGMLSVCINNKFDLNTYLDFDHPLQKDILEIVDKYCQCDGDIDISIDNCSSPMYGMPFYKMGIGYLKLFLGKEGELLKRAFTECPILIGGLGHLDTTLIEASKGNLISKTGAEGLCIVVNIKEEKALITKAIDGNTSARSLITIEALNQLGWLEKKSLENTYIQKLNNREIKSLDGQIVGKIKTMFSLKELANIV